MYYTVLRTITILARMDSVCTKYRPVSERATFMWVIRSLSHIHVDIRTAAFMDVG